MVNPEDALERHNLQTRMNEWKNQSNKTQIRSTQKSQSINSRKPQEQRREQELEAIEDQRRTG